MNEKQTRTLRYYLVLPLLVLPFVTIAFWVMRGGAIASDTVQRKSGLNTALPDAHIAKDSTRDKLSFYEQANADSAKRKEQLRNDPNFRTQRSEAVANEMDVREIQKLNMRAIRERIRLPVYGESVAPPVEAPMSSRMIQKATTDPDLEAINQTIEKLAALQNPVKPPANVETSRKNALTVETAGGDDDTYFGKIAGSIDRRKFLNDRGTKEMSTISFSAIIPTAQVLQAGSVVKLQLSQSVMVSGNTVSAGTMVYAVVAIENERMFIRISSIQSGNVVYPVSLSVFDLDGIEGIYAPGSASRDVIKSTTDQSLQSVNVLSVDPSIKTQAVVAGMGAAKNLFSKKIKAIRVTIAAGYRVLLRDNKVN